MSIMSSRARHEDRERDKIVGWVVWSLLLIRRVGEHRSLFLCLCPYLRVEMQGSRTVSFSCPWLADTVLQLHASDHLLRMALSTHKGTLLPEDAIPGASKPPHSRECSHGRTKPLHPPVQLSHGTSSKTHSLAPSLGAAVLHKR